MFWLEPVLYKILNVKTLKISGELIFLTTNQVLSYQYTVFSKPAPAFKKPAPAECAEPHTAHLI